MNAKTLKALKGSIKKWEGIVAGKGADKACANCPLCELFLDATGAAEEDCVGCPVKEKTNLVHCVDSPYAEWLSYCNDSLKYPDDGHGVKVFDAKSLRLAKAELRFLKSLLPKEHK